MPVDLVEQWGEASGVDLELEVVLPVGHLPFP